MRGLASIVLVGLLLCTIASSVGAAWTRTAVTLAARPTTPNSERVQAGAIGGFAPWCLDRIPGGAVGDLFTWIPHWTQGGTITNFRAVRATPVILTGRFHILKFPPTPGQDSTWIDLCADPDSVLATFPFRGGPIDSLLFRCTAIGHGIVEGF